MNKQDFFVELSGATGVSLKNCKKILKVSYLLLNQNLKQGKEVKINNFGKFFVKTQKEKLINFAGCKDKILLPQKNIVCFKMSKNFKNSIR